MSLLFCLFISSPADYGLNDLEINLSFKATMVIAPINTNLHKRIFTFLYVDFDRSTLFEVDYLVDEVKRRGVILAIFVCYAESEQVGRLMGFKESNLDEPQLKT
jgi:hypothetical protein